MVRFGRGDETGVSGRWWAQAAAGWCAAFATLHVFWAVGGTTGLATSAGTDLAHDRPVWFVVVGLWGVAALLVGAAALGVRLARPAARRAVVRSGYGLGALLLLRGLTVQLATLAGVYDGNPAISQAQLHWSLILWNPWFILGGVLFLMAARGATTARRR